MSAIRPGADVLSVGIDVRLVPQADIPPRTSRALLIRLMGAQSEDGDRAFAFDVEFAERLAIER